jgi:hypothetical protein
VTRKGHGSFFLETTFVGKHKATRPNGTILPTPLFAKDAATHFMERYLDKGFTYALENHVKRKAMDYFCKYRYRALADAISGDRGYFSLTLEDRERAGMWFVLRWVPHQRGAIRQLRFITVKLSPEQADKILDHMLWAVLLRPAGEPSPFRPAVTYSYPVAYADTETLRSEERELAHTLDDQT